jgi:hypothetical protein
VADQSDVENALVVQCALALGLGTGYQAGAYGTANTGNRVTMYRGWPTDTRLYQDALAGTSHISVFAESGMLRNTTRFPADWVQIASVSPTLTAAVSGATVTLGGTVTAGNVVGMVYGPQAYSAAYAVVAGPSDTLTTLAAALAAKAPGATSAGAVITAPSATRLRAGVMVPQPVLRETRRQEQGIRISFWCHSPGARDALVSAVDSALASLLGPNGNVTEFFTVRTGEAARLRFRATYTNDMTSRDRIWRRDLCYTVEYPTTLLEQDPIALFIGGPLWKQGVLDQWGDVEPSTSVQTTPDGLSVYLDAAGNLVGSQPTS